MAKKAARAARSTRIEGCASPADLHEFLTGTCGFKLHAGFSPATGIGENVYVINDSGDMIDVSIVDDASTAFLDGKIKELTMATTTSQYQMIVQADFQKAAIQRAKAPATLGRKDRHRVVYNAASRKEDTKKSILSKINGLRYQTGDEQGAFNEFFDVREIVDKFYAEYEKVRNKLAASIAFPAGIPEAERDGYATTLMNRLVFTYFLQTPDPATGRAVIPDRFLQTLYGKHASRPGQSYYHCLCHLWFDHFNVEKPRTRADGIFEHVPYLNGGLFSRRAGIEDDGTKLLYPDIDVPDEIWEEIFTLLDGYNWTIVESDEDDDELSISPSILGHIYEKQCNQKETGSYYTPDHVTTYIARECIANLATDRVNEHFKTKHVNFTDVLTKESLSPEEIEQVKWFHENVLLPITVCDNACGSGAFLLAAEKILVDLHQQCSGWTGDPATLHAIKKHVVTRNLYGVDLQPGSIEIAKLRLWLSMIPAMQSSGKVEPLPNIDYNILPGNSLVGFVKLPSNWGKSLLSNPDKLKRKLDEYRGLKDAFRSATASADREDLKEKIDAIRAAVRAELDALLKEDLAIAADQVTELKPFHWAFEYEEVFSRGGFDVVVGNPPYISSQAIGKKEKPLLQKLFKSVSNQFDYCLPFVESSVFKIMHPNGRFGYIMPNTFLKIQYGFDLRRMLQKNVDAIIDFGANQVFSSSITNYTCILFCKRGSNDIYYKYFKFKDDFQSILQSRYFTEKNEYSCEVDNKIYFSRHYSNYKGVQYYDDVPWLFFTVLEEQQLLTVFKSGKTIETILDEKIHEGSSTGADPVFILNKCKVIGDNIIGFSEQLEKNVKIEKGICKPYTSSVSDYRVVHDDQYVILPYKKSHGIYVPMTKSDLERYPMARDYLKENEAVLKAREQKATGTDAWFLYSAPRSLDYYEGEKIIMKFTSKHEAKIAIDKDGFFHNASISGIQINPKMNINIDILFNLLISDFTKYFLARFGSFLRGGYVRYEYRFLKKIPVVEYGGEIPDPVSQEFIPRDYFKFDPEFVKFIENFLYGWISDPKERERNKK